MESEGYSDRIREMVPAARWLEFPGLGHVPMVDDPALIASTITEFVAQADAVRSDVVRSITA
jgi:pimeloyl-ACP methyl ester carboxylesterase